MSYRNLTTDDIRAKLESDQSFRLIDVREQDEYTIAHIEGSELLPLSQAREWITTLPRDAEIIFFCHHGARSQQIASIAASQFGFTNVANMLGGIEEWSLRIDARVPRY